MDQAFAQPLLYGGLSGRVGRDTGNQSWREVYMAIKVLIKRTVPASKAKEMIPLFREMRALATTQPGYISGETLRSMDNPEDYLVISSWQASENWQDWLNSSDRQGIQAKVDALLGGNTEYEVFHYGFSE
jgi:heme-degrading monooxygenase HmoA